MNRAQVPFLFICVSAWHLLLVIYKAFLEIEKFLCEIYVSMYMYVIYASYMHANDC